MIQEFTSARERYKPDKIKCVLVAESPPKAGSGRFFYYENVTSRDGLFIETMRVLYGNEYDFSNLRLIREQKRQFLERFRDNGFFVVDSNDEPIAGLASSVKRKKIRAALPLLELKLWKIANHSTPIILISASVFAECYEGLRSAGFNIINNQPIELPVMGHQRKFQLKLARALAFLPTSDP